METIASEKELAMPGRPAFPEVVRVGLPNIGDWGRFLVRIRDMLDRRGVQLPRDEDPEQLRGEAIVTDDDEMAKRICPMTHSASRNEQ